MRTETSSVNALPDMHLMGHTCANLNGDLFFVLGGTNEDVACVTAANTDLWIYETLTGYWRRRECIGQCPPYLSSSASCIINRIMFVFGGHSSAQDNWVNSLYSLDLETFIWRNLGASAKAEPTKPIRSDKNVGWAYNGQFYIFGGYGWSQVENYLEILDTQPDFQLAPDSRWPKFGWNNQLVAYNPLENRWRWPTYTGNCPSARAAHSGALVGDKYYVFGGRDSNKRLNDLYTLDMRSLEWSCVAVVSDPMTTAFSVPIRHLLESMPENESEQQVDEESRDELQNGSSDNVWNLSSASSSYNTNHSHFGRENFSSSNHHWMQVAAASELAHSTSEVDEDDEEYIEHVDRYPQQSNSLEQWSLALSEYRDISSSSTSSSSSDECLNNQETSSLLLNNMHMHTNDSVSTGDRLQHQVNNQEIARHNITDQRVDPAAESMVVATHPVTNEGQPTDTNTQYPTIPVGRSFCSFTQISNEEILLFGGVDSQDKKLEDCWLFNMNQNNWRQIDLKHKKSRLWHSGSRTRQNEIVIIGGSCSDKIDEYCAEVLTFSLVPKSLKRLALDVASRSIRLRTIQNTRGLPAQIGNLIRLRKQALALNMRKSSVTNNRDGA